MHPAIRAAQALGWQSARVPVAGGCIHLVRTGEGPPLLLLHGWPEFWLTWRPLMQRLASRYTLIAPDLRGFGATGKWEREPSSAIGPEVHARHCLDLLDALEIERVVLIGHDIGAYVMQAITRLAPARITGLFFFDCPHVLIGARWAQPSQLAEIWYQSFNQLPIAALLVGASQLSCRAFLAHFLRHWAHRKDVFDDELDLWTEVYRMEHNLEGGFDWYRSIAAARLAVIEGRVQPPEPITIPTRVLWGRHDPILRAEWADGLSAIFTDLECSFAEDSGHFPFREEPELSAQALLHFLARIGWT